MATRRTDGAEGCGKRSKKAVVKAVIGRASAPEAISRVVSRRWAKKDKKMNGDTENRTQGPSMLSL
jgi:hypothetical protein